VSALSDPNSLIPSVSLLAYNLSKIHVLVDSGSTHCFVDLQYAHKNKFVTYSIPPIVLQLFDGTSNFTITQAVDLSILYLATGDVTPMIFYLTPLDSECKLVLGHNWLTHFNPLIDWVLGSIKFWTTTGCLRVSPLTPSPVQPGKSEPGLSDRTTPGTTLSVDMPVCAPPHISLVNSVTFNCVCKLEGSIQFLLQLLPSEEAKARSSSDSFPSELTSIPLEYHNYADVFSKAKASELLPHRDYDLKINLEEGASPPLGTLYSLSPVELSALRTFINKNLATGFIRPTTSSHAAPVLFVKKKDSSLRLC